ncbi:MAG: VWA domain-containing protein [Sumerlaeia bacterium]
MGSVLEWRFLHPWFLVLLPLPLIWLWWHLRTGAKRRPAMAFSGLEPFRGAGQSMKTRALKWMPWVRTLVLMLGIVALARPQYGQVERRVAARGIDISLAIDVSGSMVDNNDRGLFLPNRMEVAKEVVQDFVSGRENDRLSIVLFAKTAAVLVPPTFDRMVVANFVSNIRQNFLDGSNTAIGMGLALAVERLKDSEASSRIVILLTDGQNNAGTIAPLQAAEAAKALDIRVYTIGMGAPGAEQGLDEGTLQEIANTTGGKYYRATSEDVLMRIYNTIDELEKTEIEVSEYADYEERFAMLWYPALILLGLEVLLRAFWIGRLP